MRRGLSVLKLQTTENTSDLINQARAGIHRADAIEENKRAERYNKVNLRADWEAAKKRWVAETRTGNGRASGEQSEGGGNCKNRAGTAISNADQEQMGAVRQQSEYKRLNENQEEEIQKEAERKIKTHKRSIFRKLKKE